MYSHVYIYTAQWIKKAITLFENNSNWQQVIMQHSNVKKNIGLLAESPARIHAAVDPEAWWDVTMHQVDTFPRSPQLSSQLSHD